MSPITSPSTRSQPSQGFERQDINIAPIIVTPSTPPRGRKASRYPSQLSVGDPGRVPLHRRGTSKTYERLEDLLREAGYKETRIYTPETERAEAKAEERKKQEAYRDGQRMGSGRNGMGAVMDFIAGWMPGANKQEDSPLSVSDTVADDSLIWGRSLPPSPLAHKRILVSDSGSTLTSPASSGSIHSHRLLPHANPRVLLHQPSSASSLRTYAQVSAARGYLRHMASTPNMVQTRNNTDVSRPSTPVSSTPPLPTKWIESVTKAVLGSSADAHIGGPPPSRPSSRQSHKTYRSTPQTSALSDRTNRHRRPPPLISKEISSAPPPALTAYLHAPQTAPISVTNVRVVCRSAPASRSSSRAGERLTRSSEVSSRRERFGLRPKSTKLDCVPTLASTRLESDDVWAMQWVDGVRVFGANDEDHEDHDDDDDDGEIDLARLLVPPKRQHSIRSLRQHLHRSESARALRSTDVRSLEPWASDDDDSGNRTAQSLRTRSKRNSVNDDDDGHGYGWEAMGVPGFDQVGAKRRRGLPGTWSNLGSST